MSDACSDTNRGPNGSSHTKPDTGSDAGANASPDTSADAEANTSPDTSPDAEAEVDWGSFMWAINMTAAAVVRRLTARLESVPHVD